MLADIRQIFAHSGVTRFSSKQLVASLLALDTRNSTDPEGLVSCVVPFLGARLTPRSLAGLLQPFGINARTLRVAGRPVRGYDLSDFTDALTRKPLPKV